MSCVLRISGKQFAAREYAYGSNLPICAVHIRGEPRLGGRKNLSSGVNIAVSDADFANLKGQIRDALKFFAKHNLALRRLMKLPGVESSTLDFGITGRKVAAQFDCFPPELLLVLGKMGIGLEISL